MRITLDEKEVKELFKNGESQSDVLLGLYQKVVPNWDAVVEMNGFPKINKTTNGKFFDLFIDFDKKHHPRVMAGGMWLNNGFSSNDVHRLHSEFLNDWEVEVEVDRITYKEE